MLIFPLILEDLAGKKRKKYPRGLDCCNESGWIWALPINVSALDPSFRRPNSGGAYQCAMLSDPARLVCACVCVCT